MKGLDLGVASASEKVSLILQHMYAWIESSPSENIPLVNCFRAFFVKFPRLGRAIEGNENPAVRKNYLLLHGPDLSDLVISINLIADILK